MEKNDQKPESQAGSNLLSKASLIISTKLTEKLKREVTVKEVSQELNCIKYGIISDNIPLNIEVYNQLEINGINLLYKETPVKNVIPKRRTVIVKR